MGDDGDPTAGGPGQTGPRRVMRVHGQSMILGEREAAPLYADQFEIYHGNANPELARKIAH